MFLPFFEMYQDHGILFHYDKNHIIMIDKNPVVDYNQQPESDIVITFLSAAEKITQLCFFP